MRSPSRPSERGQAAIVVVLLLTCLIGAVALVIDVGGWRSTKADMVSAADAGALAGAASLSQGADVAVRVARDAAIQDGATSATASVVSTFAPGDTVVVDATAQGVARFSRVLGVDDFDITARGTAVVRSYTSIAGKPLIPLAVLAGEDLLPGQEITVKDGGGGGSTGNFGALVLPTREDGCSFGEGAHDWGTMLSGDTTPCTVHVGDELPVKTGNMAGVVDAGLGQRIVDAGAADQRFEDVVQLDANGGLAKILQPDSPRLVAVPVVTTDSGDWPNGTGDVTVTAFVYVFITDWGDPSGAIHGIVVQANSTVEGDVGGSIPGSGVQNVRLIPDP